MGFWCVVQKSQRRKVSIVHIFCKWCGEKILVSGVGECVCSKCSNGNVVRINEFYSNVYSVVWFVRLFYLSLFIFLFCFVFGVISTFEKTIVIFFSFVCFLWAIEGGSVGVVRTMLGVFYKKERPVLVYSYSFFMLVFSFLLLFFN